MKDFVLTVLIAAALIAAFSYWGQPNEPTTNPKGYGTRFQGDSGPVLPGDGTEPVTATIPPETETVAEVENTEAQSETIAPDVQINIIDKREERNTMNEIIIAFWHGVAVVLLGEAGAIGIAIAWTKIKKGG